MTVRNRGKVWWYDFGHHRYRGPIPEARTKYEAEQAEVKLKRDVFEGKYGKQFGTKAFAEFVGNPDAECDRFGDGTFLEWSNTQGVEPIGSATQAILAKMSNVSAYCLQLTALPKPNSQPAADMRAFYRTWLKYNSAFGKLIQPNHEKFLAWLNE